MISELEGLDEVAQYIFQKRTEWFSEDAWPIGSEKLTLHLAMGIAGEAGETIEPVKKWHRGSKSWEEMRIDLEEELADLLAYLLQQFYNLEISPVDALNKMVEKCEARWAKK